MEKEVSDGPALSSKIIRMREQIARAIEASMFAPHELPITDPWLHNRYLETSDAVLATIKELALVICYIEVIGPGRLGYIPIDVVLTEKELSK